MVIPIKDGSEAFEGYKVMGLRLEKEDEVVDKGLAEGFWDLAVDELSRIDFGFEVKED